MGGARGGFGGGPGYGGRGGFGGGYGGPQMGGRSQIFVSNVSPQPKAERSRALTCSQIPYNVGWQDLKDLFRQGGKFTHCLVTKIKLEYR